MDDQNISDEFVKRHYPGLYSLLLRRIKDASVAAEMLQEAVITAMRNAKAGRVAEPDKLAGYIYRVALNLYRNYCRAHDNRPELRTEPDAIQSLPADNTAELSVEPAVLQRVCSIVAALPTERDREIVKRFYLDEEDKESICASLGLSPLHFDKVMFRARQRMRALLEAKGFAKSDFFGVLLVCAA